MVNLNELITLAKMRADLENSNFIGDLEAAFIVNSSAAELYGLLAIAYEDYFSVQFNFTITDAKDGYTLPFPFFKLVDLEDLSYDNYSLDYKIIGSKLIIKNKTGDFSMTYIPQYVSMATSDSLLDNLTMQYWYEYIVVDSAIKMLQKEESDTTLLALQKQQLLHRIEAESANRDANKPMTVNDRRKTYNRIEWEF